MSNKPKIYSFCPAGCKWETVHKEDFEKSAAFIPVAWSGAEENYFLEIGKEYKIFSEKDENNNFTCSISYFYKKNNVVTEHIITWTNADKYANNFNFRLLDAYKNDYGGLTLVYEIAGKRYSDKVFASSTATLLENEYLNISGASKVLIFNEDAEIVARGEQGPQGPQGPRGEQGLQGIQGPQGEQGIGIKTAELISKGDQEYYLKITLDNEQQVSTRSFVVPKGKDGAQGVQGPQGERGPQGTQGPRGEQGEKGERGEQGEQGPQGERGLQGEQGVQGLQGPQGVQGLQGVGISNILLRDIGYTQSGHEYWFEVALDNGETLSLTSLFVKDGKDGTLIHTTTYQSDIIIDNPEMYIDYYFSGCKYFSEKDKLKDNDLLVDYSGNVYQVTEYLTSKCRYTGLCMKPKIESGGKEAYINCDCAIRNHSGAVAMFCLMTPYANNTFLGGTIWQNYIHFTLKKEARLENGQNCTLIFESDLGQYTIVLNSVQCVENNGVYYWSTQNISATDENGNSVDIFNLTQVCSLLIKSSEV